MFVDIKVISFLGLAIANVEKYEERGSWWLKTVEGYYLGRFDIWWGVKALFFGKVWYLKQYIMTLWNLICLWSANHFYERFKDSLGSVIHKALLSSWAEKPNYQNFVVRDSDMQHVGQWPIQQISFILLSLKNKMKWTNLNVQFLDSKASSWLSN